LLQTDGRCLEGLRKCAKRDGFGVRSSAIPTCGADDYKPNNLRKLVGKYRSQTLKIPEFIFCLYQYIKRGTLHHRSPSSIHIINNKFLGATTVRTPKAANAARRVLNINKHSAHSISSQNGTGAINHKVHTLLQNYASGCLHHELFQVGK
jgi:hypothetical protein